jgi:hypothetical protein
MATGETAVDRREDPRDMDLSGEEHVRPKVQRRRIAGRGRRFRGDPRVLTLPPTLA